MRGGLRFGLTKVVSKKTIKTGFDAGLECLTAWLGVGTVC